MERGKQMLLKDGLIDEAALERERKYQMSEAEKVEKLGKMDKHEALNLVRFCYKKVAQSTQEFKCNPMF